MQLDLDKIRVEKEQEQPRAVKTFMYPEHLEKLKAASKVAKVPMYVLLAELIENFVPEVGDE